MAKRNGIRGGQDFWAAPRVRGPVARCTPEVRKIRTPLYPIAAEVHGRHTTVESTKGANQRGEGFAVPVDGCETSLGGSTVLEVPIYSCYLIPPSSGLLLSAISISALGRYSLPCLFRRLKHRTVSKKRLKKPSSLSTTPIPIHRWRLCESTSKGTRVMKFPLVFSRKLTMALGYS